MSEIGILKAIEGIRNPFLDGFFELVSFFGDKTAIVLIVAVIYFVFNKQLAQKLCFTVVFSSGVNGVFKNFICRPRPFAVSDLKCTIPDTATGYSFPSGHTQNSGAWSFTLARASGKVVFFVFAAIIVIAVAFSRMYVGAHYLTDVICGALIGAFLAILMSYLFDRAKSKTRFLLICALILVPFGIIFLFSADPHFDDFYKSLGMTLGLPAAIAFEKRFVNFGYGIPMWKKTLRVLIAVAVALAVRGGMKLIYFTDNVCVCQLLHTLRYFALVFLTMGVAPLGMKKFGL